MNFTDNVATMERKGNALFNDALNTFYLRLYGVGHNMVKDHSDSERGYYFRLAAMVLLYVSPHRHDNTYHSLCYTSRGALEDRRKKGKCHGVTHMAKDHSEYEGEPAATTSWATLSD